MFGNKIFKREAGWCVGAALQFVLLSVSAFGQPAGVPYHPEWHRAPFLNLSDARTVATRYTDSALLAHARGLSTTVADFDEDGMPFVRERTSWPQMATTGCSFGGYHAINFALRHPDLVTYAVSMSGAFDM